MTAEIGVEAVCTISVRTESAVSAGAVTRRSVAYTSCISVPPAVTQLVMADISLFPRLLTREGACLLQAVDWAWGLRELSASCTIHHSLGDWSGYVREHSALEVRSNNAGSAPMPALTCFTKLMGMRLRRRLIHRRQRSKLRAVRLVPQRTEGILNGSCTASGAICDAVITRGKRHARRNEAKGIARANIRFHARGYAAIIGRRTADDCAVCQRGSTPAVTNSIRSVPKGS